MFVFLFSLSQMTFADTIVLQSNINEVTVYSLGAGITHQLKIDLPAGQNTIKLLGVSLFSLANSLQIKDKELTVINATLVKKLTEEEKLKLLDEKSSYAKQLEALENVFSNGNSNFSVTDIKDLIAYYDTKIIELKAKIRKTNLKLLKDRNNGAEVYMEILVSSATHINKEIELSYVNGSAAWVPEYEVFASDINTDLELKYIAKIINSTGVDWSNVRLSLSMNSPFDKTGEIPTITPDYIKNRSTRNSYGRGEEESQQSVNIEIKAGEKELEQLKIEGIEYEEYNAPSNTKILVIKGLKSIPANGGIYKYDVFQKVFPTSFVWYAFPRVEESSYLISQITNWKNLSIADGKVTVYFKGVNIGDSYIHIEGFPDTLDIPIGQNNEVVVVREIIGDKVYVKESNNKIKETVAYSYSIKSNRDDNVKVKIFDQIPVSQTNGAKVDLLDGSNAYVDKATGIVIWSYTLEGKKDEKNSQLIYNLEYDKWLKRTSFSSSIRRRKKTVRKYRAKL